MNEAIMIWLYLSLGGVVKLATLAICCALAFFCTFALFNALVTSDIGCCSNDYNDRWVNYRLRIKMIWGKMPTKTIILFVIIILAYPSKDDLKYIIGGSLVINGAQAASDIEGVEKLPENLVNAMNVFLEKAVKDN